MKIKMNIKNVLVLGVVAVSMTSISLFFMNTSFATNTNTAKITVETANIRKTPDANASIIELANQGDTVEILETEGEWYKVKYGKIIGYLRKDLLEVQSKEEIDETENETSTENQVQNNSTEETTTTEDESTEENTSNENAVSSENIEPENTVADNKVAENIAQTNTTTEGEIGGIYKLTQDTKLKVIPLIHALEVGDISKDTEVEILNIINKWAYIKTEDKEGWVVLEKLEKIKGAEPAPETTEPEKTLETPEATKPVSKTMYANAETVNVRSQADRSASIVTTINFIFTVIRKKTRNVKRHDTT